MADGDSSWVESDDDGDDENAPRLDPNSDVEIDDPESEGEAVGTDSEFDSDDDIPLADLMPLAGMAKWTRNIRNATINPFTGNPGPNPNTPGLPFVDYFYMMFSEDFFVHIANETNRYARQESAKKAQQPGGKSDRVWENQGETTAREMKAFIGTVITMGINKLPQVEDYWSSNIKLGNQGIMKVFSIGRWRKLAQYIHLSDNECAPDKDDPGRDRLYKIRPLLEMCNANFKSEHYSPHQNVSVDEAMIGFKGRCFLTQYMPGKPTKWGLKSWMLSDSHTGYCIHADIYTGAKDGQGPTEGLGYSVVKGLAEHVRGKNHHLYCDNYFTSPKLLVDLLPMKIYASGTVRNNRKGLPPNFKLTDKADRGTTRQWQKGDVIATRWKDRKDVYLLSTNGSNRIGQAARRVGGTRIQVTCPEVITQYNTYMGGVDLNDQLRTYYNLGRKARKYWKYIMWFYLDVCLINAWIIYDKANPVKRTKKFNQKDFRLEVSDGLEAGFTSRKRRLSQTRPILGVLDQENVASHRMVKFDGRKRACQQCSRMGRKTPSGRTAESTFGCDVCQINLCKGLCFMQFHS